MCAYEAKGCQAVHMRRGARRWLKRVVMIEMCTHAGGYYEVYTEAFGCVSGFGVPRAGCGPDALMQCASARHHHGLAATLPSAVASSTACTACTCFLLAGESSEPSQNKLTRMEAWRAESTRCTWELRLA